MDDKGEEVERNAAEAHPNEPAAPSAISICNEEASQSTQTRLQSSPADTDDEDYDDPPHDPVLKAQCEEIAKELLAIAEDFYLEIKALKERRRLRLLKEQLQAERAEKETFWETAGVFAHRLCTWILPKGGRDWLC